MTVYLGIPLEPRILQASQQNSTNVLCIRHISGGLFPDLALPGMEDHVGRYSQRNATETAVTASENRRRRD